jgi:hypothetical protein
MMGGGGGDAFSFPVLVPCLIVQSYIDEAVFHLTPHPYPPPPYLGANNICMAGMQGRRNMTRHSFMINTGWFRAMYGTVSTYVRIVHLQSVRYRIRYLTSKMEKKHDFFGFLNKSGESSVADPHWFRCGSGSGSRVLITKNYKKLTAETKLIFCNLFIPGPTAIKENIQNFKQEIS